MTPVPKRILKTLGPPAKPFLHKFWQFRRGMTLGVKCLAYREAEGLCLVRHTYVPGWSLPGGGVDPGETIFEAAERELREETCITLDKPAELFAFYANPRASNRDHVALMICRDWHCKAAKKPDFEIAEAAFFALDELPDTTTASTRARLAEVFDDLRAPHTW